MKIRKLALLMFLMAGLFATSQLPASKVRGYQEFCVNRNL